MLNTRIKKLDKKIEKTLKDHHVLSKNIVDLCLNSAQEPGVFFSALANSIIILCSRTQEPRQSFHLFVNVLNEIEESKILDVFIQQMEKNE